VQIALYLLGAISLIAGLAGLVLPALPGAPLLFAGVLLIGWAGHFAIVGWGTVLLAAVVALLAAAADLVASLVGARVFGASRWAVAGATLGLAVGLFLGLPGILLGPPVGAMLLEFAKDPDLRRAARAGVGAFLGFLAGAVVKVALALVLLGVLALDFLRRQG